MAFFFISKSLLEVVFMNHNFLTVDEMADALKVRKSWLYSRTREKGPGAIPRMKVGKYIRFVETDVMAWLRRKQEEDRQ
jgi:excisionase family DNA binding protein